MNRNAAEQAIAEAADVAAQWRTYARSLEDLVEKMRRDIVYLQSDLSHAETRIVLLKNAHLRG